MTDTVTSGQVVYVLTYCLPCGTLVDIGVYSTLELAEQAAQTFHEAHNAVTHVAIEPLVLDQEAAHGVTAMILSFTLRKDESYASRNHDD
jgi:hypothetical protein